MSNLILSAIEFNRIFPRAFNPRIIYREIEEKFPRYGVTTPVRIAGFLSQVGHESGGFSLKEENLNYSAKGLRSTFGKYFRSVNADNYARQPEKIANYVYANRMGNGTPSSGDGWKYRGRGFIQLTGKNNYTLFARDMELTIDEAIEYLESTEGAVESALWFWNRNRLNLYADKRDVRGMTRRINGGYNGIDDRISHWNHLLNVLKDDSSVRENRVSNIVLKLGSRGNEVAKMQRALGLTADGRFGPNTEAAVKSFQRANQLIVDGVAGPNTLRRIYR